MRVLRPKHILSILKRRKSLAFHFAKVWAGQTSYSTHTRWLKTKEHRKTPILRGCTQVDSLCLRRFWPFIPSPDRQIACISVLGRREHKPMALKWLFGPWGLPESCLGENWSQRHRFLGLFWGGGFKWIHFVLDVLTLYSFVRPTNRTYFGSRALGT